MPLADLGAMLCCDAPWPRAKATPSRSSSSLRAIYPSRSFPLSFPSLSSCLSGRARGEGLRSPTPPTWHLACGPSVTPAAPAAPCCPLLPLLSPCVMPTSAVPPAAPAAPAASAAPGRPARGAPSGGDSGAGGRRAPGVWRLLFCNFLSFTKQNKTVLKNKTVVLVAGARQVRGNSFFYGGKKKRMSK